MMRCQRQPRSMKFAPITAEREREPRVALRASPAAAAAPGARSTTTTAASETSRHQDAEQRRRDRGAAPLGPPVDGRLRTDARTLHACGRAPLPRDRVPCVRAQPVRRRRARAVPARAARAPSRFREALLADARDHGRATAASATSSARGSTPRCRSRGSRGSATRSWRRRSTARRRGCRRSACRCCRGSRTGSRWRSRRCRSATPSSCEPGVYVVHGQIVDRRARRDRRGSRDRPVRDDRAAGRRRPRRDDRARRAASARARR